MNATVACEAKQYGDMMICGSCCMMWRVDAPIRPACGKAAAAVAAAAKARADKAVADAIRALP